jgi:hypothetical protein
VQTGALDGDIETDRLGRLGQLFAQDAVVETSNDQFVAVNG